MKKIYKKIKYILFIYSKAWQYNEAMRFVLWVAQKNNLQA